MSGFEDMMADAVDILAESFNRGAVKLQQKTAQSVNDAGALSSGSTNEVTISKPLYRTVSLREVGEAGGRLQTSDSVFELPVAGLSGAVPKIGDVVLSGDSFQFSWRVVMVTDHVAGVYRAYVRK